MESLYPSQDDMYSLETRVVERYDDVYDAHVECSTKPRYTLPLFTGRVHGPCPRHVNTAVDTVSVLFTKLKAAGQHGAKSSSRPTFGR